MFQFIKYVSATVAFCLIVSSSFAARTVQIMYFNPPTSPPDEVFMYALGEDPVDVDLPQYNFTPCYNIPSGDQILRFLPRKYLPAEEIPENAPFVRVPEKWKKVFILAFYDRSNSTMPLKFRAINASPEKFDNGNTMFINFSPKVIYGMLGDNRLIVKPGSMVINKDSYPPGEDYSVNLRQMNVDRSKDYRFLTKMFRHYPDQRKIMFIYTPEGSKSVKYFVTTVREYYAGGSQD